MASGSFFPISNIEVGSDGFSCKKFRASELLEATITNNGRMKSLKEGFKGRWGWEPERELNRPHRRSGGPQKEQ